MIVGILKEIKAAENRVSMTPAGVEVMLENGHDVLVETEAGMGSGFDDAAYREAGAEIVASPEEIYRRAGMVMHVKEPQPSEYPLIRAGQIFFTYFHFAASEQLTRAMIASGAVCIAYETIVGPDGSLPLLTPMSEVAGRMAAQEAAKYAERTQGGRGILLGGIPGVEPATVMVMTPQVPELFWTGIMREVRQRRLEPFVDRARPIARHLPYRLRRLLFRHRPHCFNHRRRVVH